MKRTVSIKLITNAEQNQALTQLQNEFNLACNKIVPIAAVNQCWNRIALHHLAYYETRNSTILGSQMVCNAIKAVIDAYRALKIIKKGEEVSSVTFKTTSSVHYDKRTYTLNDNIISLYTLFGRIHVPMCLGQFQQQYLERGVPKEAELLYKKDSWYFNLVLDLPEVPLLPSKGKVLGIDLGENNLAATSTGRLFGGGKLRHKRDKFLGLRGRLQSNGTKSCKQLLAKISGKEARHVKHVNHEVSKAIIEEAVAHECDTIVLEKLTNIRKRIRAGKRMRTRLHRWPWAQLQEFMEYKARAKGLKVVFVNPAYTSKTCATCGSIGVRSKHRFVCKLCGIQRHSDLNASQNIRRIAMSADVATGTVNCPYV